MKVKSLKISFQPSGSTDVVGYRLYMEPSESELTYNSPHWDLGNVTEFDLSALDGMTSKDGVYNIGIVAVDEAGNESSMSVAEGVVLDFMAPDPPGEICIERS